MANPSSRWDLIPVYGVYKRAPGDDPITGKVEFKLSDRVLRVDGRVIYPDGATVTVTIGKPEEQDPVVRAAVRAAWRAVDELVDGFDGEAWDIWWDTKVLPAAVFTGFPAADDPDISHAVPFTVIVRESLSGAAGKQYAIQPLLAHLEQPIPGINLGGVVVPPGSPSVPAPMYAKGIAGGVAGLDADGDVVDASGAKVVGGVDESQLEAAVGSAVEEYLTANPPEAGPPGDPGEPGEPGEPGAPGTTDFTELDNVPALWRRWSGTQSAYDALGTYDDDVLYVIKED